MVRKIWSLTTLPLVLPLFLTIPRPQWNRYVATLLPVTATPIVFIAINQVTATVQMGSVAFPIVLLTMLCALPFSIAIWFTSKWEEPPVYNVVCLYLRM